MSPALKRPFSIGRSGDGARMIVSQVLQDSFGRTCRITLCRAGIFSSTSVTSSPSLEKCIPPQPGQTSPGVWMISSRGRCSATAGEPAAAAPHEVCLAPDPLPRRHGQPRLLQGLQAAVRVDGSVHRAPPMSGRTASGAACAAAPCTVR